LEILKDDREDEKFRPLEVSPHASSRQEKTIEQTADEIERSEARRKEVAKKHGLPMTQGEYEERKRARKLRPTRI
jgi:hypothetical protein